MNISLLLGIVSGLILAAAFITYYWQVIRGSSTPNATTWLLWSILSVMNAASYLAMTVSIVKGIVAVVSAVLCVYIFVFSLFRRKFARLTMVDYLILVGAILGGIIWIIWQSATVANIALQAVIFGSFLPTIYGLRRGILKEKIYPWFIWSAAYLLATAVIILRFDGNYYSLIYPFFIGVCMHGFVGLLAYFQSKRS